MANLLRFAPFRDELEIQSPTIKGQRRETAQIAKRRKAKGLAVTLRNTVGHYGQQLKPGAKVLKSREAELQAHSPPKSLCF